MECFVTTMDNPWDYFTQFDQWYAFDTQMGYNTCAYLARVSNASSIMSDAEYNEAVEQAVDEICRMNLTGNYRKIVKKDSVGETDSTADSNEESLE